MKYLNFDLVISQGKDSIQARVVNSPVGQATAKFQLQFSATDLSALAWEEGQIRRISRHLRLASSTTEYEGEITFSPESFGKLLFDSVFLGDVKSCLMQSIEVATKRNSGLRLRLRLDQDVQELVTLPWEYLYLPTPYNYPFVLTNQTAIVRYLEKTQAPKILPVTPPLKLLVVISNPHDVEPLDVNKEYDALNDLILINKGIILLEKLEKATSECLRLRLQKNDIHLLHFIGHGYFDEETNEGGLVLEDENGESRKINAHSLATILRDCKTLRLVFLNACDTAKTSYNYLFGGVSYKLVDQNVPTVIAMQKPISDASATLFATEVYRNLSDGSQLDFAVAEARKLLDVESKEQPFAWSIPVLFSRSEDNQLVRKPRKHRKPPPPPAPDISTSFRDIRVTCKLKMSFIPSSIYFLLNRSDHPLIEIRLKNLGSITRWVRITSQIEGHSSTALDTIEISPNKEVVVNQLPIFLPERLPKELSRASLTILVDELGGMPLLHTSESIWILSRNSATIEIRDTDTGQTVDLSRYLGAFVTPNNPSIMKYLRIAAKRHPEGRLYGYQRDVLPQVKAIFATLKEDAQITYINSITTFNPEENANTQRVRLPRESLEEGAANAIDGTLLFASLLEAASLNPAIVIVPGHAFLGWQNQPYSDEWNYLETTMIGTNSFEEAMDIGNRKAKNFIAVTAKNPTKIFFRRWSLHELRTKYQITPLE